MKTKLDLYREFQAADDAWHNALVAEYGERGAVVERYKVQGKGNQRFPESIWLLCLAFRAARDAYLNHQDPVECACCGLLDGHRYPCTL